MTNPFNDLALIPYTRFLKGGPGSGPRPGEGHRTFLAKEPLAHTITLRAQSLQRDVLNPDGEKDPISEHEKMSDAHQILAAAAGRLGRTDVVAAHDRASDAHDAAAAAWSRAYSANYDQDTNGNYNQGKGAVDDAQESALNATDHAVAASQAAEQADRQGG